MKPKWKELESSDAGWIDGFLVSFGRNRSGMDAGRLDFSIAAARVNALSFGEKTDLVRLIRRVADRIELEVQ